MLAAGTGLQMCPHPVGRGSLHTVLHTVLAWGLLLHTVLYIRSPCLYQKSVLVEARLVRAAVECMALHTHPPVSLGGYWDSRPPPRDTPFPRVFGVFSERRLGRLG